MPALAFRTVVPFHDRSLELVAGPQCPVIKVAAWLTLLSEFPRAKNSRVGQKPEVAIRLPVHLRAWTVPHETRVALSCGNNQKSGRNTLRCASFPALKYPIPGGSHTVRQRRFNMRVCVDKVGGTRTCVARTPKQLPFGNKGLNVPRVFVVGSSPLEMSALALNRGFSGTVGNRYLIFISIERDGRCITRLHREEARRLHVAAHNPDEGNFASAHGALLMHPETLAQSLLQYLAGTALGQLRF